MRSCAAAHSQSGLAVMRAARVSDIMRRMFSPAALVLWLGLILGIKHATEVDHLVAIANIVSESRSILRAAVVGVCWGVGHTISVFVVGVLVILLRVEIPPRLATSFE